MNESRYQYVIDTMSEDDWAKARKINEEVRTNGLKHLDYTLHATRAVAH